MATGGQQKQERNPLQGDARTHLLNLTQTCSMTVVTSHHAISLKLHPVLSSQLPWVWARVCGSAGFC